MTTEPDRAQEAPHWRDRLEKYPSLRQVFHALCALGEEEDATELLEFAAQQEWMADLARRAASESRLDTTTPLEPETDDLLTTLCQLRTDAEPDFKYLNHGIDERHDGPSRR